MYKILAAIVKFCHWAWVIICAGLFSLFLFLVFCFPTSKLVPLACIIWQAYLVISIASCIILGGCPLRLLEESLRKYDDPDFSYHGSFIAYHIGKIFKIEPPPAIVVTIFLIAITVIGLAVFVGLVLI